MSNLRCIAAGNTGHNFAINDTSDGDDRGGRGDHLSNPDAFRALSRFGDGPVIFAIGRSFDIEAGYRPDNFDMTYFAASRSNAANADVDRHFGNLADVGRRGRSVFDSCGFDAHSTQAVIGDGANSSLIFVAGYVNFGRNASAAFSNFYRSRPVAGVNAGRSTLADGANFGRSSAVGDERFGLILSAENGQIFVVYHGRLGLCFCLGRRRRRVFLICRDRDHGRLRGLGPALGQ